MTFVLTAALREIIRADRLQPWEGHQLTVDGFKLEQGVWVRRTAFKPVQFDHVSQTPRRRTELPKIDGDESEKQLVCQNDMR